MSITIRNVFVITSLICLIITFIFAYNSSQRNYILCGIFILWLGIKNIVFLYNQNQIANTNNQQNQTMNGLNIALESNSEDKTFFDLFKNTPMIKIKCLSEITGCDIYAKCEYFLPFSSKDRMIKNIIETAIKYNLYILIV